MSSQPENRGSEKRRFVLQPRWAPRPLLTLPQILFLLLALAVLFVGLDLNRREQRGLLIQEREVQLQEQVDLQTTRQVELIVTRDYVASDDYVAAYARNEAGMVRPGEIRIVPLVIETTPLPTLAPTPTPDPAYDARPWQAWWRLMSDSPLPSN